MGKDNPSPQQPRRKRRAPQEVRDLIIAAAAHEFAANGYTGATTAAIARRAEVTEAQIFRFYDSKAELFREAVFQPLDRHFAAFQERSLMEEARGDSFYEIAGRYINQLQDFMAENSGMLMSLLVAREYMQGNVEGMDDIEGLRAYFERGASMMSRRTKGSEMPVPPELMVRVSFGAVLGNVIFRDWLFPPGIATDQQIRDAIATFTMDGVAPNSRTPEEAAEGDLPKKKR